MPPKSKAGTKPKDQDKGKATLPPQQQPPPPPPRTVNERSQQRYEATQPFDKRIGEVGISGLTSGERQAWASAHYIRHSGGGSRGGGGTAARPLGAKAHKEVWRAFNGASLPQRALRRPTRWGLDRLGRDVGELSLEQFAERAERKIRLSALLVEQRAFFEKRERAAAAAAPTATITTTTATITSAKVGDAQEGEIVVTEEDIEAERDRRKEMAVLRGDLYGVSTGSFATDPEWDDVVPIPLDEPEGALAAIAYPDDYAEAISYLRAVMAAKEYSARCLRLTARVISMNPAHYTVWLYRFAIVSTLGLPIPEEIEWLNEVALDNPKNYQIWHHRHLLLEALHPAIEGDADEVARLAVSEAAFIATMLEEDAKNYHVWSYRQVLVRRLGLWPSAVAAVGGREELLSVEALVDEDVRNNSAWSHRFFLVFSDPAVATPGSHATELDPRLPPALVDREVAYAQAKILLAPQNQSPWSYLRGVLVKGGRRLAEVEGFVRGFVGNVGSGTEGEEEVRSTHALDLLAEILAEKGEKDEAVLCLDRLGDRWDRIRKGYWEYRKRLLLGDGQGTGVSA